jgi:hypothetical protein|uniref:Uncharacterized protein n=1 Tax=viral metagenome TaxID=1070528 RepID=A0A6C0D6Y5_9ZZZZ
MKRIKSAPANIAEMVNRKKPTLEKSSEKIVLIIPKQIAPLKNQKIVEKTFNSIMIDYINDKQILNHNDEEALLLSILYYYFCEKIFTKNNLREFIMFITQTLIKYIFTHSLHEFFINNKDLVIEKIRLIENISIDL